MRYIELSPKDKILIESLKSTSSSAPLRRRLECLLLSHGGMQVKNLSKHFDVTQKTIYEWFDLWDKGSITSMPLKGGRGAKKKLRDIPKEEILKLVEDSPRKSKLVLVRISEDYGVDVSEKTLQRFLKICRSNLAKSS